LLHVRYLNKSLISVHCENKVFGKISFKVFCTDAHNQTVLPGQIIGNVSLVRFHNTCISYL